MIYLDADLIHRYNSLQWRDACQFIGALEWGDLTGETLMDIGCGTGQNSTQILLKSFPELEKIIATDGSPDMIRMAKEQNPSPRVDYFVVDIQDEEANKQWLGSMTKIISIHCIHWLPNQVQAFRNVFNMLKPGGRAALLFVLSAPNIDVHSSLQNGNKWKNWLKDVNCPVPVSQANNYGESYYKDLLLSIGFEIEVCKAEEITFPYESDEIFKGFCKSVCPLEKHIPNHLKKDFAEDLLKAMIERCGRLPDGRPNFHCTNIQLKLRKKLEES